MWSRCTPCTRARVCVYAQAGWHDATLQLVCEIPKGVSIFGGLSRARRWNDTIERLRAKVKVRWTHRIIFLFKRTLFSPLALYINQLLSCERIVSVPEKFLDAINSFDILLDRYTDEPFSIDRVSFYRVPDIWRETFMYQSLFVTLVNVTCMLAKKSFDCYRNFGWWTGSGTKRSVSSKVRGII